MKGYMENWVGDRDMPKDIGGWQNGQKAFHIRFMNKKGVDILHLKYSKSAANTLVDKYNRLFLIEKNEKIFSLCNYRTFSSYI